ncbi:SpdD protein [Streptomyces sp. GS7]|uniref:SpdD protein n=1 Tax=Streptomyces sp. GS7 TaxID=2692234 RepID=UPI001318E783|nr:SpdD protein [Streptomyces sp. GS7]QHC20595.1 SpdD protein [Streptomyces sp. GS7]
MFTPKYPPPDTAPPPLATAPLVPVVDTSAQVEPTHATTPVPVPVPATAKRSTVQLTPGGVVAIAAGGTATVLIVGAVLVSMLLAVAITAASVAVCALVVRSILTNQHTNR